MARNISSHINRFFCYRVQDVSPETLKNIIRNIMIAAIDRFWQNHIENAQRLRAGIHLRSYAQRNPLYEYVQELATLYKWMKLQIANEVVHSLASVVIRESDEEMSHDEEQIQVQMRG